MTLDPVFILPNFPRTFPVRFPTKTQSNARAWAQGALTRPGERRTENGARGKRSQSQTFPSLQASKLPALHFTVRPCGPLYRAHPLRFSRSLGKAAFKQCGRTNRTYRTSRTAPSSEVPQNQSVACEARHAPTGPRAGRALYAHARPAPCVVCLCVLCVLCDKNILAVLPAVAGPKSAKICGICGSPASCT